MVRDQQQINFESIVPMCTQFRKTNAQWTENENTRLQNKREKKKQQQNTNNKRIKYMSIKETEQNTQLDWAAQNENGNNLLCTKDVLN